MSEWLETTFDSLVDFYDSQRIPLSSTERAEFKGEYRYYGAQGVIDYVKDFIFDGDFVLVAEDGENLRSRKEPIAFEISGKFWVNNHAHILKAKQNVSTNKFIQSLLNSIPIDAYVTGAAQPKLSQYSLKSIKVNVPDFETQQKIAAILSAYDDLIENNLKQIKLLEEMAQITYEEWFVRFKFPNHENTPVDEVTGLPLGWRELDLENIITVKHGFAFKGEDFEEIETSKVLLTPGNFKIGGGIKLAKLKYYSESAIFPKEYILKKHDLLVTMTDLSMTGDTLGYPLLVPSSKNKMYLHNQRLGKIEPTENFFPVYFLYHLFRDSRYQKFVVGSASGVAVKHTSPNRILKFKAPFPQFEIGGLISEFDKFVKPIFEEIDNLLTQNQLLKEARDILLPRLMTGKIAV